MNWVCTYCCTTTSLVDTAKFKQVVKVRQANARSEEVRSKPTKRTKERERERIENGGGTPRHIIFYSYDTSLNISKRTYYENLQSAERRKCTFSCNLDS